jgi:hypothetical protein
MLGHGRVELTGVTDGDHRQTQLFRIADVTCVEHVCEELVKVLQVTRTAAACLFEDGDLDAEFVRYGEGRGEQLRRRLLGSTSGK